jgi:hypothetical protein
MSQTKKQNSQTKGNSLKNPLSTSAEELDNLRSIGKELVKRKEINNTPFTVITTEKGSFGTMGKYRLTEVFETEKEAITNVQKMTWNRIVQVTSLITKDLIEA